MILIVCIAFVGLLCVSGQARASAACPDYLVIGARGSGQEYLPEAAGDMGVGSTVYSFYEHLTKDFHGSGLTFELDPVPNPPYVAQSIASNLTKAAAYFHLPASYEDSVRTIEPWVDQEVASRTAACPDTKVVLSGYSQGAQGMADALQRDLDPSVIAGAAFFGDPYFNPFSPGDRGSFDSEREGLLGVRPQYGSSIEDKVFSYCRNRDPICQGYIRYGLIAHISKWEISQHEHYATVGDPHETDTEMAADSVATRIRVEQRSKGNQLEPPGPKPLSGPLDVAFAIDSTGSMGGIIESVKQNVAGIAAQLQADDPDFRVALVDYKDAEPFSYEDAYQAEVDQGFTADLGEFDSAVQGLYAGGGGDTPESVYTGMMTALELPWRTGAHKVLIVIGDAGGHPVDPLTGYTAQDVVAKSLSLDPVAVSGIPASQEAGETFGPVAEETGGSLIPAEGEAAEAVIQSLQATETAPVASLGEEPYEGPEDAPIVLSAAASYSPSGRELTYEWDFNGDGTTDETTTNPVVGHTFAGGYDGLVTVRVVDEEGQSAVAQAHVKAEGEKPQAPGTPGTPQLAPGNESVTASWSSPTSGGPVDLYELMNAEGVAEGLVAAGGPGQQSATVGELPNGAVVQLSVTAINGSGTATSGLSDPATPAALAVLPLSQASGQASASPGGNAVSGVSSKKHCVQQTKKRRRHHHASPVCKKSPRRHRHKARHHHHPKTRKQH